jgi:hypothetical protein
MSDAGGETRLKVVDAFDLDDERRQILRPGEMLRDREGRRHRLPRYFYEVPSHEAAEQIRLTPNFGLNEFLLVDIREAAVLQRYPRYIPCAVRTLAFYLQRFREAIGLSVHMAVNGGYRSPGHKLAAAASPHMWGTAADIYRIGRTRMAERETIGKFNTILEELADELWVMPYGHGTGEADDHVHVDLGYLVSIPREISEDRVETPQESPRFAFEERRRHDRRGGDPSPARESGG